MYYILCFTHNITVLIIYPKISNIKCHKFKTLKVISIGSIEMILDMIYNKNKKTVYIGYILYQVSS